MIRDFCPIASGLLPDVRMAGSGDHVGMNGTGAPETEAWAKLTRLITLFGVVLGGSIALILVVGWLNMPMYQGGPPMAGFDDMGAIAPPGVLSADEVPPALKEHYEAAQTHFAVFESVPCFCGCQEMLGHRHLGDCFVRPDGTGLEAHALGCGVCLGEAAQVASLIESGVTDVEQIRTAVVATWGDPYFDD